MFIKRESIENNYLYEKDDLYPNIHYKDTCGTLTLYAKEKELPYVILKNSFNDRSLTREHKLNLKNNPQAEVDLWVPNIQETKTSQYGCENIRYNYKLKREYIKEFKDLHNKIIPWNTIRYIF